jgi:CheY-like chemotaxis protein
MKKESPLKEKHLLVVDDEPDVVEFVGEVLDGCLIDKAANYETARQYIQNYTYDIVILDIMGVNGFKLLKDTVSKGFPTVMLTAHALSPESLKKSMMLGAVSFLPKDRMSELEEFLEDVALGGGKPVWQKLFDKLGGYFNRRFGLDWQERDEVFKEFMEGFKEGPTIPT